MYFDGFLNIDGARAGVYFISPSGGQASYVLRIHFKASNNAAEYEAALHGLRIAVELGIKRLMPRNMYSLYPKITKYLTF
jgi:ribonuclease HI